MKLDSSDSDTFKAKYKLVPRSTCVDYSGRYKIISADEATGTAVLNIEIYGSGGVVTNETKTIEFGANGLSILRR